MLPPRGGRHRAAGGLGVGAPKAGAKAKARAGLRRPAARGVGDDTVAVEKQGVASDSVNFDKGEVVEAYKLPLEVWTEGLHIAVVKGTYWEEEVQLAGKVEGLTTRRSLVVLTVRLEGTQSESLVRWSGANPGTLLEVDVCKPECPRLSKDGLVHCSRIQKVLADRRAGWMDNLLGGAIAEGGEDEMRRLRAREQELAKQKARGDAGGGGERQKGSESASSESGKK